VSCQHAPNVLGSLGSLGGHVFKRTGAHGGRALFENDAVFVGLLALYATLLRRCPCTW